MKGEIFLPAKHYDNNIYLYEDFFKFTEFQRKAIVNTISKMRKYFNIPKKIRIFVHTWYENDEIYSNSTSVGVHLRFYDSIHKNKNDWHILINVDCNGSLIYTTVKHEFLHAIFSYILDGLRDKGNENYINTCVRIEEKIVLLLERLRFRYRKK